MKEDLLHDDAPTENPSMQNDLTFFTNEPGSTLLDRFKRTLRDVKFFDILVGYFRTSGFDFDVRGYKMESLGKLDHVIKEGPQSKPNISIALTEAKD